jgi:glutamine amidotransferase
MGNLRSVEKAIERLNKKAVITSTPDALKDADRIILPGVGNFAVGMKHLRDRGFFEVLNHLVLELKIPILGICMGMQLITKHSEEGNAEGFGWINAITKKFQFSPIGLKIPHMGWNTLSIKKNDKLMEGIDNRNMFYFVHSYFINCEDDNDILCTTNYGNEFVSSFSKGNIYGTQFHPEKSHDAGLKIINNFLNIPKCSSQE